MLSNVEDSSVALKNMVRSIMGRIGSYTAWASVNSKSFKSMEQVNLLIIG